MMDRKTAKELLHIQGWLARVTEIVERGRDAYLVDDLLQEAGASLMMKLGEAANRLSKLDVLAPEGVDWALAVANRNFIIHQYDELNRAITWETLSPSTYLPGRPHCGSCSPTPPSCWTATPSDQGPTQTVGQRRSRPPCPPVRPAQPRGTWLAS